MLYYYYYYFNLCFVLLLVGFNTPLPLDLDEREERVGHDEEQEKRELREAQRKEYVRYATSIIDEINKSEEFKKKYSYAKQENVLSRKAIDDYFDLIIPEVKEKLNELKRKEIEYQRGLLSESKKHMTDKLQTGWNPIHHENKETFEKEDLKLLFDKLDDNNTEDSESSDRKRKFKEYEMEKERKRKRKLSKMAEDEKAVVMKAQENARVNTHEKIHEPGHKAQLEEVWERQDGMDPEGFDYRTFFNLHDKNSDGNLDEYEYQTLFLTDLDKVYNESAPHVDVNERDEEMKEMWEYAKKEHDENNDSLISFQEFIEGTMKDNFVHDEEWKPLVEKEQFTPEEYEQYLLDRRLKEGNEKEEEEEEEDPDDEE